MAIIRVRFSSLIPFFVLSQSMSCRRIPMIVPKMLRSSEATISIRASMMKAGVVLDSCNATDLEFQEIFLNFLYIQPL